MAQGESENLVVGRARGMELVARDSIRESR